MRHFAIARKVEWRQAPPNRMPGLGDDRWNQGRGVWADSGPIGVAREDLLFAPLATSLPGYQVLDFDDWRFLGLAVALLFYQEASMEAIDFGSNGLPRSFRKPRAANSAASPGGSASRPRVSCARAPSPACGKDMTGVYANKMARRGVVLVPEGRRSCPAITVRDYLRLGGYARYDPEVVKKDILVMESCFPILAEEREAKGGPERRPTADAGDRARSDGQASLDEPPGWPRSW
jgi:hypothetical protein